MCYPKPGLRCSTEAHRLLTRAERAYEADPTLTNYKHREEARHNYNLTPAGITALHAAGRHKEAEQFTALRAEAITNYEAKLHRTARSSKTPFNTLTAIATNPRNPYRVREQAVANLHKRHPVFSTFPLPAVKGMLLNPNLRGVKP